MSPPLLLGAQRPELDHTIDDALTRVRERMSAFGGTFAVLAEAMDQTSRGGKRFRPALVSAAVDAMGGRMDAAAWATAASFELLHAAFVIHDDIIDNDDTRRGEPNVIGIMRAHVDALGVPATSTDTIAHASALLAGDLLLHEAQRLIARCDAPHEVRLRLLDLLDDAVMVSAAGELADALHAALPVAAAQAILTATHDKTAVYSFSAPLRAGAVLAGADAQMEAALADCGSSLGLAFQLVDDLIGTFGTAADAGRAAGADLRERKQTVLIALARSTRHWREVERAIADAATGPVAVQRAQRALAATGARAELEQIIRERLALARDSARTSGLPDAAIRLVDHLADAIEGRIP